VPSENVTIRPSWLSFSTFSMCVVSSVILRRIRDCQVADCPVLHTLGYASSIDSPTDESPSSSPIGFPADLRKWGRVHSASETNRAFTKTGTIVAYSVKEMERYMEERTSGRQ
jgi:hypothetical protein